MAIQAIDNYDYRGRKPNFERDSFKRLADLKSFPETEVDEGHISFCEETGEHYEFRKDNSIDPTTGRWRKYKEVIDALDSKDKSKSLSANQGRLLNEKDKELKGLIDAKVIEAGGVSFDLEPTPDSSNPVTSGGIYKETSKLKDTVYIDRDAPTLDPLPQPSATTADFASKGLQDWDGNDLRRASYISGVLDYEDFREDKSYSAGDTIVYSNRLYEFASPHKGPWSGTDVVLSSMHGILKKRITELGKKIDNNSADIADVYRESTKSNYDEIVKAHYYKGNGEYTAESYNAYSVAYYNVSAGDEILVKGAEKGTNVASISFVSVKGEKAISTFDISLSKPITVNRYLLIPEGVNYVALSVGYTDYYRLSLYKVLEKSRLDTAIEDLVSTNKKVNSVLSISDFIMPATEEENLLFNDQTYLNLADAKNKIFSFEKNPSSKFVMSRLIEVKPSTAYTIAYVTEFFEWDKDFNIINVVSVNPSGYDLHKFTTNEKTKFLSIKVWVGKDSTDASTLSLQEGTHSLVLEKVDKILNIKKYKGIQAGFEINQDGRDIINRDNVELYRGEKIEEYSYTQSKYYKSNLAFAEDSYGSFSTQFFEVSENDIILAKGKGNGVNVSSISLVSSVNSEYAIKSIFSVNSNPKFVRIEVAFTIPKGVNYVAISSSERHSILLYKKNLDLSGKSRLDTHDEEINLIKQKFSKNTYTPLIEDEIDKGHYYNRSGVYSTDSHNVFNIKYYSVTEGQKIRLYGKYNGTIYAFVLVENKKDNALYKYGIGNSPSDFSEIDETIIIPSGVNWIAMSYSSYADTAPYLIGSTDYLKNLDDRVIKLEKEITIINGPWKGKRLLAIGDSITAPKKWQEKVGQVLGMNVRTHAKGGIGLVTMVDGDGSETPPDYDPDDFGTSVIYPLNSEDVRDVDIIAIMGAYNERKIAVGNLGSVTDVYQADSGSSNSFCARFNHVIDRVYE